MDLSLLIKHNMNTKELEEYKEQFRGHIDEKDTNAILTFIPQVKRDHNVNLVDIEIENESKCTPPLLFTSSSPLPTLHARKARRQP